jgi:hypothetical protein
VRHIGREHPVATADPQKTHACTLAQDIRRLLRAAFLGEVAQTVGVVLGRVYYLCDNRLPFAKSDTRASLVDECSRGELAPGWYLLPSGAGYDAALFLGGGRLQWRSHQSYSTSEEAETAAKVLFMLLGGTLPGAPAGGAKARGE